MPRRFRPRYRASIAEKIRVQTVSVRKSFAQVEKMLLRSSSIRSWVAEAMTKPMMVPSSS